MGTWGQFTFEPTDKVLTMTDRLAKAGLWHGVKCQIEDGTNLSEIFTDCFRGYMNDYEFNVDCFNDDVQIALEIIEKNYLQVFKNVL